MRNAYRTYIHYITDAMKIILIAKLMNVSYSWDQRF